MQWAVYQGEPITGISVIWMNAGLDAGPILKQVELPIEPGETAESLERRLAERGAPAVEVAIEQLDQWDGRSALGTPQDPSHGDPRPADQKGARTHQLAPVRKGNRQPGPRLPAVAGILFPLGSGATANRCG